MTKIRRWRHLRGGDRDQTVMTMRRSASYPEERDVGTACRGTTPREIVSAVAGSVSANSLMLTTKVERGRNMGKKEEEGGGEEKRNERKGRGGGSYGDV